MSGSSASGKSRIGWLSSPAHAAWLLGQAHALIRFYQYAAPDPAGGFFELDETGKPQTAPGKQVVVSARMVHNFGLAHLLGRPGAGALSDHGLRFLREAHRDQEHGGYFWIVDHEGPVDDSKQAYGHAFVLLAASTALVAERPGADDLLEDIWSVLEERFWSEAEGLYLEEYPSDWSVLGSYRGANSNMHLVEALASAFEATGEEIFLRRAVSVCERIIREFTRRNDWRLAEHYTERWEIDRDYSRDDPENMYRPYGSLPGHAVEWARLLLQVRANRERPVADWMLDAARRLFDVAVTDAWDESRGGLYYTVDFDGAPLNRDRYQWPISEAIGAAAVLAEVTGETLYEEWYRRFWDFADRHLIDHERGGWHYLLDPGLRPKSVPGVVSGKPDLYHALQSCLIPLLSTDSGMAVSLRDGRFRLPALRT